MLHMKYRYCVLRLETKYNYSRMIKLHVVLNKFLMFINYANIIDIKSRDKSTKTENTALLPVELPT